MGMSWTGLGRGIERGIRLGMAMDQHEMNKDRAEEDANARKKQRILTDMQIEKLKDTNEREQTLRATNQTLYHLGSLKSDPQGYANQLQSNPEMNTSVSESINRVGQMLVDARGIGDGMQREFAGFTPTDDGRLMVNLKVTKEDGSVYEPPLTERGSTDPNDPVLAFTLDDLGGLTAAIDAEVKGLESKKVGLGDMSPANARKSEIGRKQGIADQKDMLKYEYGLKGQLEKAKAKAKGGGISGGWKQPDAEKHIKSIVATGMGLNSDNIENLNEDTQKKFASTVDGVFRAWKANPELGISGAYESVIGSPDSAGYKKLPQEQQEALAVDYLKQNGVKPEGDGMLDFGDEDYSEEQINLAKAKLNQGNQGGGISTQSRKPVNPPASKTYQGKVNGKSVKFTDADIQATATKYGISPEAVKRQLNILEK